LVYLGIATLVGKTLAAGRKPVENDESIKIII
jgi:hypothetical protein